MTETVAPRAGHGGRNLPTAALVGVGLLVVVAASLFVVKEAFVAVAVAAVCAALWELRQAVARRGIDLPLLPLWVGSAGIVVSSYVSGLDALIVALVLTVAGLLVWRVLDGRGETAVRDVAASLFAAVYLPFLAGFVMLLLAAPDGARRVMVFILLAVASDVGGYFAGVRFGRHPLAPSVSPKKSWEGLAGSVALAMAVGAASVALLLDGSPWLGVAVGAVTAGTATLGDLAESMIKRDLELKDMGSLLPEHGGVLDRLDSMLLTAPFVYLLLTVSLPLAS